MIDHAGIYVSNYALSCSFYTKILEPLNLKSLVEHGELGRMGFGCPKKGAAVFWITDVGVPIMRAGSDMASSIKSLFPMLRLHIAFCAPSRKAVDAFYEHALSIGARSNSAPGVQKESDNKESYAAYVNDPDGHNIGAVYDAHHTQADGAIIDHVGIYVIDYQRSKHFYEKALGAICAKPLVDLPEMYRVGFGFDHEKKPRFWITGLGEEAPSQPLTTSLASSPAFPMMRLHLAFQASERTHVNAFHKEATNSLHGGRCNGTPGLRVEYHNTYYASYAHDPDGHNIEAVCHANQ